MLCLADSGLPTVATSAQHRGRFTLASQEKYNSRFDVLETYEYGSLSKLPFLSS
jgi:hypothetical protein